MSANKDRPHVFVLPEDDENRQLATGFHLQLDQNISRQFDVQPMARSKVPAHLSDRVFVLGALQEPKDLRSDLGSCEAIGLALAKDCREKTGTTWGHRLLQHNAGELARLRDHVRPILFPAT